MKNLPETLSLVKISMFSSVQFPIVSYKTLSEEFCIPVCMAEWKMGGVSEEFKLMALLDIFKRISAPKFWCRFDTNLRDSGTFYWNRAKIVRSGFQEELNSHVKTSMRFMMIV